MVRLEVIAGSMFSGKSDELIKRLRKATYTEKIIMVVKPFIDNRVLDSTSGEGPKIASRRTKKKRSGEEQKEHAESFPAHVVKTAEEFKTLTEANKPQIIGIDEAQFFEQWMVEEINRLLDEARNTNADLLIIVSGLDMDAWRKPFGIMPQLMAMADDVRKESAVCCKCKGKYGPARLTWKKPGGSQKQVDTGNTDKYEARCRHCYEEDSPHHQN